MPYTAKIQDFIEKYGHLRPSTYDICEIDLEEVKEPKIKIEVQEV